MTAHTLSARVLDGDWQLEAWRAVVVQLEDPQPFVTPEWQRAWWEHFGDGELSVLRFDGDEHASGLAGMAALHRDGQGCARFLGGEALTDYPGPAVTPGRAGVVAEGLIEVMQGGELGWRMLDLRNARPEDGFADALYVAASDAGLRTMATADEPVAVLDLPASWEDYLGQLARQPRRELQRKERRLSSEFPGAVVRTADAASVQADVGTLGRLIRSSPGEKGSFMSPEIERFFRRIAADFLANGLLRLDVLEDGGRPLAATLGFQTERAFFLYNMGFDAGARPFSPGIVLVGRLIKRALEDGLERFDFMRGLERYKLEFGAASRRLRRVVVRSR